MVFKSQKSRKNSVILKNPIKKSSLLINSKKFSSIVFLEKEINKKLNDMKKNS